MSYSNVKLWFAKNEVGDIVTINDVDNIKKNTYSCPMCGSSLTPKAIKSKQVTSHFAHVDKSKCNSETMIHWWFKHKFIEEGDKFKVKSNEEDQYVCKEVLVEQSYDIGEMTYRPDVTVKTECGEVIFFEMAFSNHKKVKDYLDIWLGLKNIVVEVDIKQLLLNDEVPKFKALFYEGKCFNIKKNDTYYNTIGKYKEEKLNGEVDSKLRERLQKLDWLWRDILNYKKGEIEIEYLSELIDSIDLEDKEILETIFKKPSCTNIMTDLKEHELQQRYIEICHYVRINYGEEYIKYLEKNFEYVREPFIGSWYESKIILKNLYNGYSTVFDLERRDTTEGILKEIDTIIPFNMNVEKYNRHVSYLQEKFKSNHLYKSILNCVNNKFGYEFSCTVDSYQHKNDNLNDFKVIINLKYKNRKIKGCNFNRKFQLSSNIDDFFETAFAGIKSYFEEMHTHKYVRELDKLSTKLQYVYKAYNIDVIGEEYYENVYLIKSLYDYYIFNDCISSDVLKKEVLAEISDMQEVFNYISNDINATLIRETKKHCHDCDKEFVLELGEIKFFIKKDFEFPKRCKMCRELRKTVKV